MGWGRTWTEEERIWIIMKFGEVKEKISDDKVDDVENNNYCRKD